MFSPSFLLKIYNNMKCKNMKMVYLTLLVKNDKRSIISKHLQLICETVAGFDNKEMKSKTLYIIFQLYEYQQLIEVIVCGWVCVCVCGCGCVFVNKDVLQLFIFPLLTPIHFYLLYNPHIVYLDLLNMSLATNFYHF